MGRQKQSFKSRRFHGNRYIVKKTKLIVQPSEHNLSTSSKKIGSDLKSLDSSICESEQFHTTGYRLVDLELLSGAINSSCLCVQCKCAKCLIVVEVKSEGIASVLNIFCELCNYSFSMQTSKKAPGGFYESNFRFVYAMRCLGKGREAANTMCSIMNMPPPIARLERINNHILKNVSEAAKESMIKAVKELVKDRELEREDDSEITTDLCVSVDGTWMKRGHTSLYGASSIISIDSGKVLDVEVMSKYCHECAIRTKLDDLEKEREWHTNHSSVCSKNYSGSSGGMESCAAIKLFNRSVDQYGVRYTKYLGDGDSQSFKSVVESNPYDCTITKLECIGHIQKRVGGRLRRLLKEHKGKKLEDKKPLGGRGRLTQKEVDSLQVYYGKAIRQNNSSVDAMRTAIWAIYFHKLSTDDNPCHYLCPKDGWCKYNIDKQSYNHKNSLPDAVMNAIKPTFRTLADPELLKKCLHGKTQNNNESFNNLVWLRCPKTTFCGKRVLNIAVYDAVLHFNEGSKGRIEVLRKAGLEPGVFTIHLSQDINKRRIAKAELSISDLEKEARKKKREKRRSKEDEEEDLAYECGGY